MVVHQNITNLAGYFHFLNVRKIPYVIGFEQFGLRFDRQIAVCFVSALEGFAVLGQDAAEVVQAVGDAEDEVLDQCPVAHAVDASLEDHLVVELLLVG